LLKDKEKCQKLISGEKSVLSLLFIINFVSILLSFSCLFCFQFTTKIFQPKLMHLATFPARQDQVHSNIISRTFDQPPPLNPNSITNNRHHIFNHVPLQEGFKKLNLP